MNGILKKDGSVELVGPEVDELAKMMVEDLEEEGDNETDA
jgi:hypothetical protein